ncbi:MAG UNVERIFIED_CONTAM: hypothetical protein LVQ98_09630 [Rickettsiaceae bacterium]|jgi:hypothetical protein
MHHNIPKHHSQGYIPTITEPTATPVKEYDMDNRGPCFFAINPKIKAPIGLVNKDVAKKLYAKII